MTKIDSFESVRAGAGAPRTIAPRTRLAAAPGAPAANPLYQGAAIAQAGSGASALTIPDWVKDAVFYQVFPDRFANGDLGNDPVGTQPWGTPPTNNGMQGGDLNGVTQRMGYLKSLGVNALYFNPIFTAPSNHKYNTTDFEHVDPELGGDKAFDEMVDVAHHSGVKVMLDGVFNHVSQEHPWFQDVRANGPRSPYFDRFSVYNWPIRFYRNDKGELMSDDYKSWGNFATLPQLRHDNPAVEDYFLTGKDSIIKRWVRDRKIDGWRMDVAEDPNFTADWWRTARKELKSVNPNAYFVAEGWHDETPMLQGDQFDGTMNYQYFQYPCTDYFAKKDINSDEFVRRLQNGYSTEAKFGAFNILDSHDTARFVTTAGGDWYRQRPAAIFQMTYVGTPVIYYGDEIGMEGGNDPDSRRAMEWQNVPVNHGSADVHGPGLAPADTSAKNLTRPERAEQVFDLYQRLIATRKAEPTLRRGDFQVLMTHNDNNTFAYRRHLAGVARDAVVAINNNVVNEDIVVPMSGVANDGTKYTDALSGKSFAVADGKLTLPQIDGNYGAVLLRDA